MSWLRDQWQEWRKRRTSQIEEITHLTEQFYTTLEAELAKIEAAGSPPLPAVLEEIKALIDAPERSWAKAYRIEQLLVHVYDDPTMELELRRRLQEIQDVLGPPLTAWYESRATDSKQPTVRRALLARLVNDLQWRYMVNEVKRGYSKAVTRSGGWIFVATLVAFLFWALLPYLLERMYAVDASVTHGRPWYLLMLAGFAGAWGASFSMLIGLRKRLDESNINDLKLMRSLAMLVSRPLIGLGAAFILYFFLVAGLVSGGLFPDLAETAQETRAPEVGGEAGDPGSPGAEPAPEEPTRPGASPGGGGTRSSDATDRDGKRRNLALLVVLSFLAGFSEKLVPGLLTRTGERLSEPRSEAEAAGRRTAPPGGAGPPAGAGDGAGGGAGGAGAEEEGADREPNARHPRSP